MRRAQCHQHRNGCQGGHSASGIEWDPSMGTVPLVREWGGEEGTMTFEQEWGDHGSMGMGCQGGHSDVCAGIG